MLVIDQTPRSLFVRAPILLRYVLAQCRRLMTLETPLC